MDRVDTSSGSDLDFDIDLESGGTTSGEEALVLNVVNSKNIVGRIKRGFMISEAKCELPNDKDCSCSYEKSSISAMENKEQLGKYREEMISFVHEMGKETKKKHCKPPRPPKGPLLDASDMKLLKEISVLNSNRRRMVRRRTLRKIRNESVSRWNNSSLFASLVTVAFLLVIAFQALLTSNDIHSNVEGPHV